MKRKIWRQGNSYAMTLPKTLAEFLKPKNYIDIDILEMKDGYAIIILRVEDDTRHDNQNNISN